MADAFSEWWAAPHPALGMRATRERVEVTACEEIWKQGLKAVKDFEKLNAERKLIAYCSRCGAEHTFNSEIWHLWGCESHPSDIKFRLKPTPPKAPPLPPFAI
jgi:hypothetical protein